jgi:uncharacterized protein (DUF1697 family)
MARPPRYVALLRGINVGGRNKVAMAELRAALEAEGFEDVSTYIQSGNVLFRTDRPSATLETEIEGLLERRLGIPLTVVVRSRRRYRRVVDDAPDGFGASPGTFNSDVFFLKRGFTSRQAMAVVELREGVDQAWPGPGVLYFARLTAELTKSKVNAIVGSPEYQRMTLRSWTTTRKLYDLLDGS